MTAKQETEAIPTRVEFISVHIDPETKLYPFPCPDCRVPMETTWQEWQQKLEKDNLVVKNTEPVPYYQCRRCDPERETTLLDGRFSLILLKATLSKLDKTSQYRIPLEQRIASLSETYQERK